MFEYLALGSAIVFAVCLIALMFFYASPSTAPESPKQQYSEEHRALQHKSEAEKPFWEKATTDPVAAFTLFLVIFTAVLSGVGVIQLRLLLRAETVAERSANAAKDGADAAKKSADVAYQTLLHTQRAVIVVSKIEAGAIVDPAGKVTAWSIQTLFKNSGPTSAKRAHAGAGWKHFEGPIPANFDYASLIQAPDKTSPTADIGPTGEFNPPPLNYGMNLIETVLNKTGALIYCINVTYNDVFDGTEQHHLSACFKLELRLDPHVAHAAGQRGPFVFNPMYFSSN